MHLHYVRLHPRAADCLPRRKSTTPVDQTRAANGGTVMKSATLPGIETPLVSALSAGYQKCQGVVARLPVYLSSVLRGLRDERYVMRGDEQLRGPMSDEFRRAGWW